MAKHTLSVAPDGAALHEPRTVAAVPDESRIAPLAYQLWLARGCPIGSDQDDWFQAETLLKRQSEELREETPASE